MNNKTPISADHFSKRLVTLCLKSGLSGLPKNEIDQHILLKSAVLLIKPGMSFSEREIDAKLSFWINEISGIQNFDTTTLRRWLVDAGYLTRTSDGSSYQVKTEGPWEHLFDPAVSEIDIQEVILDAREEIARRKQAYLERKVK
jgi:hypothetical protein